jgi:hypothetical protein
MNAPAPAAANRAALEAYAARLESIADPSAPLIRAMAIHCDIEEQRNARVDQLLARAEDIAGGQIAHRAAEQLPGAIDRLVRLRFGLYALVAVGVLTGGSFALYDYGRRVGYAQRVGEVQRAVDGLAAAASTYGGPEAAETWLILMRNNDIERANRVCSRQDGRLGCEFALWAGPPPAAPSGKAAPANGRR